MMTTPVAEVVAELADRLLILRDGTLAENLTREELAFRLRESQSSFEGINSLIFPDVDDRVAAFLRSGQ
jgi:ABC-type glutathione transport system ATPase component